MARLGPGPVRPPSDRGDDQSTLCDTVDGFKTDGPTPTSVLDGVFAQLSSLGYMYCVKTHTYRVVFPTRPRRQGATYLCPHRQGPTDLCPHR